MDIPIKYTEAAILVNQKEPLLVDKIFLPNKLEVGQVLVKILVSGICGSQLGEIDGVKGNDPYLPHLMGHEGCGEVIQTGPGVTTVSNGDKVVLHWRKGSGIESKPPVYKWQDRKLNAGWVTTFNEHAIISENRCTKISDEIDTSQAALFGCAVTTGFGVIENNANLKMGESVVIFGAGGIGLNIIQAAKMFSAYPIIAVDIYDNRLDLARKLGATHTINSEFSDPKSKINEILKNDKLDVFIDNTGITSIIEMGYELTDYKGRIILVGVPKKGNNINIFSLPLHFGKTISGSHGGETNPDLDIPRYMKLLSKNKFKLDTLISDRFNLKDINNAIISMRKGNTAGRILIDL